MFYIVGCLVVGLMGVCWWLFWDGDVKMWLVILVLVFGMMLLLIVYVIFMFMMNSKKILGDEKLEGSFLFCWNFFMGIFVLGVIVVVLIVIVGKVSYLIVGLVVINVGVILLVLIFVGFFFEFCLWGKLVIKNIEKE